jgi:hypothetical protein
MPGVFISYRREDSSGYAGRLFDILSAHFGKDNTYMDLDTIEGGDNFSAVIEEKINLSDVLVAVIGTRWLTVTGENGKRRLDNPGDFVRHEIAKALERGIRVIPVLVGGAAMPPADELPDDLRALCQHQAMEIRDAHFHPDAQQLTDVLHRDFQGRGFGLRTPRLNRFVPTILAGAGVIIILAGFLVFHHPKPPAGPALNPAPKEPIVPSGVAPVPVATVHREVAKNPANPPVNVAGKWKAIVKYDWGDTYDTIFEFEVDGSEITGIAGFVGLGRTIWDGKIAGNRIGFMTKTQTTMGFDKPNAEERHYYKGTVEGQTIRFTMTTDSPAGEHTPIHFTAHKLKAGPLQK